MPRHKLGCWDNRCGGFHLPVIAKMIKAMMAGKCCAQWKEGCHHVQTQMLFRPWGASSDRLWYTNSHVPKSCPHQLWIVLQTSGGPVGLYVAATGADSESKCAAAPQCSVVLRRGMAIRLSLISRRVPTTKKLRSVRETEESAPMLATKEDCRCSSPEDQKGVPLACFDGAVQGAADRVRESQLQARLGVHECLGNCTVALAGLR
eukprot:3268008-Amphidinium_carterae.2